MFQGKEIKGLKIIKIVDKLAKHDPIKPINIDPVLKYECNFKEQFDTYPEPIKPSAIIIKGKSDNNCYENNALEDLDKKKRKKG